ncbi:hypothetical protein L0F63_000873 [Massospora cicadina]|nr:hypothetical protein L0F63_000873 [Massospora cicadina]
MLAWDFSTKRCQEYISRSSLEQYISIINSRLNSSGNNEAAIPFSEFISAFPPQITDGSVSRKLVDKLEGFRTGAKGFAFVPLYPQIAHLAGNIKVEATIFQHFCCSKPHVSSQPCEAAK